MTNLSVKFGSLSDNITRLLRVFEEAAKNFVSGGKFVTYIGASALGVITRMMGLILAVIGTQMVIVGLQGAFELAG